MEGPKGKSKSAKLADKRKKVLVEKQQLTEPKQKKKKTLEYDDVAKRLFEDGDAMPKSKHKSGREIIKEMKRRKSLTLKMMKTGFKELQEEGSVEVTPKGDSGSQRSFEKHEKSIGRRSKKDKSFKKPSPKQFRHLAKTSTPDAKFEEEDSGNEDVDSDLDNTLPFDIDSSKDSSKFDTDDSDIISYPKTPKLNTGPRNVKANIRDKTPSPGVGNKTPMPSLKEGWMDVKSALKSRTNEDSLTPSVAPHPGKAKKKKGDSGGEAVEAKKGKPEGKRSKQNPKAPTQEAKKVINSKKVTQKIEKDQTIANAVVAGSGEPTVNNKGKTLKRKLESRDDEGAEQSIKRKRKRKQVERNLLYCGNIPSNVTVEYLKFYFSEADCSPRIRMKKQQRGGKNKQKRVKMAILVCNSEEEYERLLELDKSMLPTEHDVEIAIQIHPLMNKGDIRSKHKVFATNIHPYAKKNELIKLFKDNGHKVVKVHHYSNRGQAYLWFISPRHAKAAAKIKNKMLRGKEVQLKYCKQKHRYGQTLLPEEEEVESDDEDEN